MVPPGTAAAIGDFGVESIRQGLHTKTASLTTASAFLKRCFLILCFPSHDAWALRHPVQKAAPARSLEPKVTPLESAWILIAQVMFPEPSCCQAVCGKATASVLTDSR